MQGDGRELVVDESATTVADLDATDAIVTWLHVAIAGTGTIVLDASSCQGRRAITLVPDLHVCWPSRACSSRRAQTPYRAWSVQELLRY